MPHFWCGVRKFSTISVLPFGSLPSAAATVRVSIGGRQVTKPSPKARIQWWSW